MLAVLTSNSLTTTEPSSLKRAQPSISPTCTLSSPTSVAWAPDNSILYVADGDGIHKFLPAGTLLETIVHPDQPVTALVAKDKGNTLIFSTGREVSILETRSLKVSQTYSTHKRTITSLALSNDATLLATSSSDAVHIHNLSLTSHSVLRGLPSGVGDITACSFHPHSRTRLLVATGLQLAVYDTTRPSAPSRVVAIDRDKSNTGRIVAIACSPYSKTLVAVACSGGTIGLVDLDKEKGLFRTLTLKAPLTSLVFSPEGASLFAGNENGSVLTVDLRTLDKGPKATSVSEDGQRVVCLAIQRKIRIGESPRKSVTTQSAAKPLVPHDVNKAAHRRITPSTPVSTDKKSTSTPVAGAKIKPIIAISPPRIRTISTPPKSRNATTTTSSTNLTPRPPVRTRTVSATNAAAPNVKVGGSINRPATAAGRVPISSPLVRKASGTLRTKTFSPPKSPLGESTRSKASDRLDVSVSVDRLLGLPKATKENLSPKVAVRRRSSTTLSSTTSPRHSVRTRTISTTSQRSAPPQVITRSHAPSISANLQPAKSSQRPRSTSRTVSIVTSPIPPSTSLPPTLHDDEQITAIQLTESRTPSPDLPNTNVPITPLPPSKRAKGKAKESMNVLGMGTPEVHRWMAAGNIDHLDDKEGRKVGFVETNTGHGPSSSDSDSDGSGEGDEVTETEEAKIEMTVQISPRRPTSKSSTTWTAVPSPLRFSHARGTSATPGSVPHAGPSMANPAHDLLHTLIRDALYDFRRETKAEIIGLHLDLVRMGRGWKKEMRDAMDKWGTELREVREENERLREENERLKRGY